MWRASTSSGWSSPCRRRFKPTRAAMTPRLWTQTSPLSWLQLLHRGASRQGMAINLLDTFCEHRGHKSTRLACEVCKCLIGIRLERNAKPCMAHRGLACSRAASQIPQDSAATHAKVLHSMKRFLFLQLMLNRSCQQTFELACRHQVSVFDALSCPWCKLDHDEWCRMSCFLVL